MKWTGDNSKEFEQPPVGTTVARCIKVIDIGTQVGEYQGQPTHKRQVIIGWELPTELMGEGEHKGKPFVVSRFYTASLNEKANLRKDLENWRGRPFTDVELGGFDSKNVLGKTCMVSLMQNEKGKVRVSGVIAMPKGMEVPAQVNPSVYFSLDEFSEPVFESLSDGYKKMIAASPEYAKILAPKPKKSIADMPSDDIDTDDIPF